MVASVAVPSKVQATLHPHDMYGTLPVTHIMFAENGVAPEVFFGTIVQGAKQHANDIPERRLMLAVLEDAVVTYQNTTLRLSPNGNKRKAFLEVEGWIASCDLEWPFSFESICVMLDLDADNLREGLARWRATQLATTSPKVFRRVAGKRTQIAARRARKPRRR
ncbi:MAG: hypothetical protein EXS68_02810 [Candidatus Ryanbacteria bacterium]|nr:hypothetical protein [Candidatus Ryanbacteria bacterium]